MGFLARCASTITSFYRIAEIDDYLDRSPATHLRLPHVCRDETKTLGLDRAELGAIIAAARPCLPTLLEPNAEICDRAL